MAEKLSREEMDGLVQCCADCLLSAHRSEGFGLNVAEFMALGRPVVATGYGGTMDFTTEANSYLVSYDDPAADAAVGPLPSGLSVGRAQSRADLVRHMRRVVEHGPRRLPRKAPRGPPPSPLPRYRPKAVGSRILARLDALGPLPAACRLSSGCSGRRAA